MKNYVALFTFLVMVMNTFAIPSFEDFGVDAYKQGLLQTTSKIIEKLDTLENKINSNENLDDQQKQEAIQYIEKVRSNIEKYETKIESAETMTELIVLNKEMTSYMKNNEDLRKAVATTTVETAKKVIPKVEAFIDIAEQEILPVLEKMCPDNSAQIEKLYEQLDELKVVLDQLENFVNSYDPENPMSASDLKQYQDQIVNAGKLMAGIALNVELLYNQCLAM